QAVASPLSLGPITECPAGVEPACPAWEAGAWAARPRARLAQRKERESNPQDSSFARFRTGCRRQSACPSVYRQTSCRRPSPAAGSPSRVVFGPAIQAPVSQSSYSSSSSLLTRPLGSAIRAGPTGGGSVMVRWLACALVLPLTGCYNGLILRPAVV